MCCHSAIIIPIPNLFFLPTHWNDNAGHSGLVGFRNMPSDLIVKPAPSEKHASDT